MNKQLNTFLVSSFFLLLKLYFMRIEHIAQPEAKKLVALRIR